MFKDKNNSMPEWAVKAGNEVDKIVKAHDEGKIKADTKKKETVKARVDQIRAKRKLKTKIKSARNEDEALNERVDKLEADIVKEQRTAHIISELDKKGVKVEGKKGDAPIKKEEQATKYKKGKVSKKKVKSDIEELEAKLKELIAKEGFDIKEEEEIRATIKQTTETLALFADGEEEIEIDIPDDAILEEGEEIPEPGDEEELTNEEKLDKAKDLIDDVKKEVSDEAPEGEGEIVDEEIAEEIEEEIEEEIPASKKDDKDKDKKKEKKKEKEDKEKEDKKEKKEEKKEKKEEKEAKEKKEKEDKKKKEDKKAKKAKKAKKVKGDDDKDEEEEVDEEEDADEEVEGNENGPTDKEVNDLAWEKYQQHWNGLSTEQQDEIYKELGYEKGVEAKKKKGDAPIKKEEQATKYKKKKVKGDDAEAAGKFAKMLEEAGFIVETSEDIMSATFKGEVSEEIKAKLKEAGFEVEAKKEPTKEERLKELKAKIKAKREDVKKN